MGSKSGLALRGGKETARLIVHATNIHTGGGAWLLSAILRDRPQTGDLILFCDRRMVLDPSVEAGITVHRVEPKLSVRLAAEQKLRDTARDGDLVLAFGNLPPLYRLKAKTVLFLQNRYLVDPAMSLGGFSRRVRARLCVERIWLRKRLGNVDRVIVQTATMSALFEKAFGRPAEVAALNPAEGEGRGAGRTVVADGRYDFVFVSSGEPHKNHRALIEAWVHLSRRGARPSLALTLAAERSADILALANEVNAASGTRIVNLGHVPATDVGAVYDSADALIFPSLGESFGLPLLEAEARGLPILAGELDYVRDLVDPAETFDPHSPRSIARAVCRFLKLPPDHDARVDAAGFLRRVFGEMP
jgi:glycosyltransferase involved in cell wall biosynthesis